jgi:diaminopimelate epimerase
VVKGHGTENDFVLVPDLDATLELSAQLVRALCDRHAGVGADGVLRIVRSQHHPDADRSAPFFMDYRNADGSIAEMCGNGVRVFARWLQREGLVGAQTSVATRGGVKHVRLEADGNIAVDMGIPDVSDGLVKVTVAGEARTGRPVHIPNPHVVVELDSIEQLASLDLATAPVVEPTLPSGQNVEFVVRTGEHRLSMRVHERGVGETRSCGTGICAAVAAIASPADAGRWQVDIPGGTCWVTGAADRSVELCGPAVLVADIELDDAWLSLADS